MGELYAPDSSKSSPTRLTRPIERIRRQSSQPLGRATPPRLEGVLGPSRDSGELCHGRYPATGPSSSLRIQALCSHLGRQMAERAPRLRPSPVWRVARCPGNRRRAAGRGRLPQAATRKAGLEGLVKKVPTSEPRPGTIERAGLACQGADGRRPRARDLPETIPRAATRSLASPRPAAVTEQREPGGRSGDARVVERVPRQWHARGQGFKSPRLHPPPHHVEQAVHGWPLASATAVKALGPRLPANCQQTAYRDR